MICANCGGRASDTHHAAPRSLCPAGRFEGLNFIRLCHACHMGWHDRSTIIYRDVFSDKQWDWLSGHVGQPWLDRWYPTRLTPTPF